MTDVNITNQKGGFLLLLLSSTTDSSLEWFMKQMSALKITLYSIAYKLTHYVLFAHRLQHLDIWANIFSCLRHATWDYVLQK